jgi:hypothetical protein
LTISRKTIVIVAVTILTLLSIYILRFSYATSVLKQHVIGVIGTLLMLQTEVTYTLRKKRYIKFGSPKKWMQAHIFTGLLGPALIILHTNWNFSGFAGVVAYITILVTASGFFGYYVYRSIPRTLKGKERDLKDLVNEQQQLEDKLRLLMVNEPRALERILKIEILTPRGHGIRGLLYASNDYYRARRQIHRLVTTLGRHHYTTYKQLEKVAFERLALERRVIMLSTSKRLLSNWNKFHKPVTLTLFFMVGVHIMTIFYYGMSY